MAKNKQSLTRIYVQKNVIKQKSYIRRTSYKLAYMK